MHFKLTHRVFQQLLEYWLVLYRKKSAIPSRVDFKPMPIVRILPHILIGEIQKNHEPNVRLLGTAADDFIRNRFRMGEKPENYTEEEWRGITAYVDKLFLFPCALRWTWRYHTHDGEVFESEIILLPLHGKSTKEHMAVGSIVMERVFDVKPQPVSEGNRWMEMLDYNYIDIGFGKPCE